VNGYSKEAVGDAVHDFQIYRAFASIDPVTTGISDATTIQCFRHLIECHRLATELPDVRRPMVPPVQAGGCDDWQCPEVDEGQDQQASTIRHQTRKGSQWFFVLKEHYRLDTVSRVVHTVLSTLPNLHDLSVAGSLLEGDEENDNGDLGHRGIARWCDNPDDVAHAGLPRVHPSVAH